MAAHTAPVDSEIHLWWALLDVDATAASALVSALAPDERARALRFHFERDRARWAAGRGLLRSLLGRYVDLDAADIQFEEGEFGKLRLRAPALHWLRFNLSHSEELVLFAIARDREVGVDVERVRDDISIEEVVVRFLSANERESLRRLNPDLRTRACFEYWTRKEACLKATGRGVAARLDEFEVTLAPRQVIHLSRSDLSPSTAHDWTLYRVDVGDAYTAAVAIEGDSVPPPSAPKRLGGAALPGVAIAPILS